MIVYADLKLIQIPETKAVSLEDAMERNPKSMTDNEILQSEMLLREEADRLIEQAYNMIPDNTQISVPANDSNEMQSIYDEMSLRHGGGFAQWVVEQIKIADKQAVSNRLR